MESWRSQSSMTDPSTTTAPILDPIAAGCGARRQLRSGIEDVSVASEPMKSLPIMGVVFIGTSTLALPELDVRSLHGHSADSGSDCGRLLASTPASQWYKILPPAMFIHEVTGSLVRVESRVGEEFLMSIMIGPVY